MENENDKIKIAKTAIITFGLISLFGDIIYEGARGIIPPYLEILLAPAIIVGFIFGLGDFIGYALRLLFGTLADTTRAYWTFTILGYCLLISIPLLAFTRNWEIAIILVLIERIAKAIRSPARDTLLSVSTEAYGRGKAFGLHELLDQVGAITGPLIVALSMYYFGIQGLDTLSIFHYTFLVLLVFYFCLVFVLFGGYLRLKRPTMEAIRIGQRIKTQEPLTKSFYFYSLSVFLNTAGLFPIFLILYYATPSLEKALWGVALLYLLAQGVDAVVAPIAGSAYDKYGIKFLAIPFILSIFPSTFIALSFQFLSNSFTYILAATVTFGIILGMQESVYRAAVADLTGISKRGTGYGIFNSLYGLGFLTGGVIFGYFLDQILAGNTWYSYCIILYTLVLQVFSLVFLLLAIKK